MEDKHCKRLSASYDQTRYPKKLCLTASRDARVRHTLARRHADTPTRRRALTTLSALPNVGSGYIFYRSLLFYVQTLKSYVLFHVKHLNTVLCCLGANDEEVNNLPVGLTYSRCLLKDARCESY